MHFGTDVCLLQWHCFAMICKWVEVILCILSTMVIIFTNVVYNYLSLFCKKMYKGGVQSFVPHPPRTCWALLLNPNSWLQNLNMLWRMKINDYSYYQRIRGWSIIGSIKSGISALSRYFSFIIAPPTHKNLE